MFKPSDRVGRLLPALATLYNSSLATAFFARRRIDFAARLHWLHYHGIAGAVACRAFSLSRFCALQLYEQLQPHDTSVILQARKILTQHIFGMVDRGELDEQKLIAGSLAHLKAIERDRGIKSAHAASKKPGKTRRRPPV